MSPFFRKSKGWIALFLAPTVILFSVIIVIPLFQSFYYSFFEWNGVSTGAFLGWENYKTLYNARELKISMKNSIIYSLLLTAYQVGLGTLFAFIFANMKIRGLAFCRNVYFVPVLLSASVVSQLWIWIYHGDYGLINKLSELIGLEWRQQWLNRKNSALVAVTIAEAWKGMGYHMLIIYAAMKNIPKDYMEASSIDGATPMRQFFSITLPCLSPIILFNLIMQLISGFMTFTQAQIITQGGPNYATNYIALNIFQEGFAYSHMGYACAQSWVMLLIMAAITGIIFKTSDNWAFYES